jgi:hypothetical protein
MATITTQIAKINFQNEDYTLTKIDNNGKKVYVMEDSSNNRAVKKVLKKEWKEFFKIK